MSWVDELRLAKQNAEKLQKELEREGESKGKRLKELEAQAAKDKLDAQREQQRLQAEMDR